MRAVNGAIESVNLRGSELEFKVIGNGAPRGICGSGLIELLSEMFLNGIISRDGKYYSEKFQERLRQKEQQKIFLLTDPNSPPSEKPVFLSEQDIGNLIRAKAAIFSATALLLKRVGLKFNDLGEIYIAGGFGCSLNIAKAIGIGLFPALPLDRFRYLGNSSLAGAQLALLSKKSRKQLVNIAKSITYIDLSSEPEYMNEYTAALFLPHTDENLFPTT
jgi:uncharacterized 2Fe-2S/4Fe-4S cluster protein (DUF4445 family)